MALTALELRLRLYAARAKARPAPAEHGRPAAEPARAGWSRSVVGLGTLRFTGAVRTRTRPIATIPPPTTSELAFEGRAPRAGRHLSTHPAEARTPGHIPLLCFHLPLTLVLRRDQGTRIDADQRMLRSWASCRPAAPAFAGSTDAAPTALTNGRPRPPSHGRLPSASFFNVVCFFDKTVGFHLERVPRPPKNVWPRDLCISKSLRSPGA